MIELTGTQMRAALPLFAARETHKIAVSCCQGLIDARCFADRLEQPTAAVVVIRRFGIAFAAGDARHATTLLNALHGWHAWYEISDPPDDWQPALAAWSKKSHGTVRYGFSNKPATFDTARLHALAQVPAGMSLRPFDRALLEQALAADWSEDQTGSFLSVDDFLAHGFGMALVRDDGALIAGCSSFCRHDDGYEIQVDTHPDERGHGYATCVCAAFILNLLDRNLNVYWDAANATSLRLAEKLGFVFERAFVAWVLISEQTTPEAVAEKAIGQ